MKKLRLSVNISQLKGEWGLRDPKTRLPYHMPSWSPGWGLELGVQEQRGVQFYSLGKLM